MNTIDNNGRSGMSNGQIFRPGNLRLHVVPHERFEVDAAARVADGINEHQSLFGTGSTTIGFAPGSTMEKFLPKLAESHRIGWQNTRVVQLVEYASKPENPDSAFERVLSPKSIFSYRNYFQQHFFKPLQAAGHMILKRNILDMWMMGTGDQAIGRYLDQIINLGGLDVVVLSLGPNGHILFNEPGSDTGSGLRITDLTEETVNYNIPDNPFLRFYPRAYTLGIKELLHASHIFLLVKGQKSEILRRLFSEEPSADLPASFLKQHQNVDVIADEDAALLLPSSLTRCPDLWESNEYSSTLKLLSGYPQRMAPHQAKHLAMEITSMYLRSAIKMEDLTTMVEEFMGAEPFLDISGLHFFIQNRTLDRYLNPTFFVNTLKEVAEGVPDEEEKLYKLFGRALNVFRFPEIKDRKANRKKLLFQYLLTNIRPAQLGIGSTVRSKVALNLVLNEVLSSKDPSIYGPAVEAMNEMFINDNENMLQSYRKVLDELLKGAEELPRFTEAQVFFIEKAYFGRVERFCTSDLSAFKFYNKAKELLIELASDSLGLCKELLGRLKVLGLEKPDCIPMIKELRASLHEVENRLVSGGPVTDK